MYAFRRKLGEERFERTGAFPDLTIASLLDEVDPLFETYLREPESSLKEEVRNAWLQAVKRRTLSEALRANFPCMSLFDQSQILSPQQILDLLSVFEAIGDRICEREHVDHNALRMMHRQAAPLQVAFELEFDVVSDTFERGGMYVPHSFFNGYLGEEVLFRKAPSKEELERHLTVSKSFEAERNADAILSLVVLVAAAQSSEHEERKALLHNVILNLFTKAPILDQYDAILRCKNRLERELPEAVKSGKRGRDFLILLETILKEEFPAEWRDEIPEEKLRLLRIGPEDEEGIVTVVPVDHFFFADGTGPEATMEDWACFPEEGYCVDSDPDVLVAKRRNISVFDPSGKKVFWGDLPPSMIMDIKGPFYVLSERDSYFEIPKWAVKGTKEPRDPNREHKYIPSTDSPFLRDTTAIDTSYMRLHAIGKIQDGRYLPNKTLADCLEGP